MGGFKRGKHWVSFHFNSKSHPDVSGYPLNHIVRYAYSTRTPQVKNFEYLGRKCVLPKWPYFILALLLLKLWISMSIQFEHKLRWIFFQSEIVFLCSYSPNIGMYFILGKSRLTSAKLYFSVGLQQQKLWNQLVNMYLPFTSKIKTKKSYESWRDRQTGKSALPSIKTSVCSMPCMLALIYSSNILANVYFVICHSKNFGGDNRTSLPVCMCYCLCLSTC